MEVAPKELELAHALIDSLKTDFKPEQFHDTFQENVKKLIQAKLEGRELAAVEKPRPKAQVVDLMSALKQSLASSKGLDAALTIIKSQPDCTVAQLANMIASFGQELCNPPAQMLKLVSPFIQAELQAVAAAIPDQVDLIHTNTASQQSAMETLKVLRLVMRLSPLLPLALLFAITLIAVRSFKSWLNWWGWPLLLTGLPGAVIGFGGAPLLRTMMERAISKRLPADIPLEVMDTIRKIVDASLREMLKPAGWEGLFLFVAGVCMVLVAAFLHLREKGKVEASEATTQIF